MSTAPTIKLNDGNQIPTIGLGTFRPQVFQSDPRAIEALEAGYRHFDTAMMYMNQPELGEALRKGLKQCDLKRVDIFVTSKIDSNHHKKENVIKNCEEALKQLHFDYVDLLLIHSPMGMQEEADTMFPRDESGKLIFSDVDYLDTWAGMVECQKRGLAKSIGVSNFEIKHLERIMANSSVKPVVNQVECHPYYNQKELLEFCKKHDIILEAYAPLGAPYSTSGFEGFAPKQITVTILTDPVIVNIGKKYDKTPAQRERRMITSRLRSKKRTPLLEQRNGTEKESEESPKENGRMEKLVETFQRLLDLPENQYERIMSQPRQLRRNFEGDVSSEDEGQEDRPPILQRIEYEEPGVGASSGKLHSGDTTESRPEQRRNGTDGDLTPGMQSTNRRLEAWGPLEGTVKKQGARPKDRMAVALRWAVQRGSVPLPRSNNKSRIIQNFSVFDFTLTEEEMKTIDGLNQNIRAYDKTAFKDHPHFKA